MGEAVLDREDSDQPGAGESAAGQPAGQLQEILRPEVVAAFENENVSMLPRPELALRIGQVVTQHLESQGATLNLLERRKLVSDLIDWLVRCQATENRDVAKADQGVDELLKQPQKSGSGSATILPANMAAAKKKIHPLVMDRLDISAASQLPRDELQHQVTEIVNEVALDEKLQLNLAEQKAIVEVMLDDMLGLGPLEPLLADEGVTDIMVNGPNFVYVEKGGKLQLTDVKFQSEEHVLNISRRIVSQVGRRVDESHPLVDARLLDGSRVNIVIPPLAIDGASISIRKFSQEGHYPRHHGAAAEPVRGHGDGPEDRGPLQIEHPDFRRYRFG